MKAELMMKERQILSDDAFVEIVIWRLAAPVAGSAHHFKYRLAYVVKGVCVLRYDNEAGKGDHRHAGKKETDYNFTDFETLLMDFWRDVDEWRE
jgi:uncharacterized protein DUF6516